MIIHLQSKGKIWLIGGYDYSPWERVDDIHLYSIKHNKWELLDIKLPIPLRECTCICSKDNGVPTGKIFIIDTELLEIKESSIKCPIKMPLHACLVDDTERSDVIVKGFINECWNEEKFKNDDNLSYPSNDIIALILSFHCIQIVHLFKRYRPDHWTITLIDLFM